MKEFNIKSFNNEINLFESIIIATLIRIRRKNRIKYTYTTSID